MPKKKEDPEKVKARVKKYLENKQQLLITGLSDQEKESFINIPNLEHLSHAKKLLALVDFWNKNHALEPEVRPRIKMVFGVPVKIDDSPAEKSEIKISEEKPKENIKSEQLQIENWAKFEKDFNDFLFEFKMSNRTREKLRTHGQLIKDELEIQQEYREAFQKICNKLPESVFKNFKPMYRQGYFYLYEKEIIEISEQKTRDEILLLLYESLRHMGKYEPVKEAKKILGLYC